MLPIVVERIYVGTRDLDATGCPVVGGTWSCQLEADGWSSLIRGSDGERLLAWRANSVGARGLFALFGRIATLEAVAAVEPSFAPAQELWAAALAGNTTARAVVRRWPIFRMDGQIRAELGDTATPVTNQVRRFFGEGGQCPAWGTAFPWRFGPDGSVVATDAEAITRVTAITRPAFDRTMAGWPFAGALEAEPPRS